MFTARGAKDAKREKTMNLLKNNIKWGKIRLGFFEDTSRLLRLYFERTPHYKRIIIGLLSYFYWVNVKRCVF